MNILHKVPTVSFCKYLSFRTFTSTYYKSHSGKFIWLFWVINNSYHVIITYNSIPLLFSIECFVIILSRFVLFMLQYLNWILFQYTRKI